MKLYEYDESHDAKWLRSVCRLMVTESEIAREMEYDRGWNEALHRIIDVIERGMIPPKEKITEILENEGMTREEAKKDCSTCKYEHNDGHTQPCRDCGTLLESYTNWEQKEKEQKPCDDAISRDMALEKMADYVASGYADSVEDFEEYTKIICQLPSVTVRQSELKPFTEEHHKVYMEGWNDGRKKLLEAMEREIAY